MFVLFNVAPSVHKEASSTITDEVKICKFRPMKLQYWENTAQSAAILTALFNNINIKNNPRANSDLSQSWLAQRLKNSCLLLFIAFSPQYDFNCNLGMDEIKSVRTLWKTLNLSLASPLPKPLRVWNLPTKTFSVVISSFMKSVSTAESCFAASFRTHSDPDNVPKLLNHVFPTETGTGVSLYFPPLFSFECKLLHFLAAILLEGTTTRKKSSVAFHFPPPLPPPLSSSSRLFLMLSYSSSMFWLPRIWLSTRRAFWVSPRWINQRGLSGRNRNPMNWSTAGSTDRPNMYLKKENKKSRDSFYFLSRIFSYKKYLIVIKLYKQSTGRISSVI